MGGGGNYETGEEISGECEIRRKDDDTGSLGILGVEKVQS
jgi:hypothetical protein